MAEPGFINEDKMCSYYDDEFGHCPNVVESSGYCKAHNRQLGRGEELHVIMAMRPTVCRTVGCGRPVFAKRLQLCESCYWKHHRGTLDLIRDPRQCVNCDKEFVPSKANKFACCYQCSMETARLRNVYGITGSELNAMLVAQGHKCWTCKRPVQRGGDDRALLFHIDHDHACCPSAKSCGKCLRKLLCFNCNAALGQIGDSAEVAYALGDYLTLFHAERVGRLGEPVEVLENKVGP